MNFNACKTHAESKCTTKKFSHDTSRNWCGCCKDDDTQSNVAATIYKFGYDTIDTSSCDKNKFTQCTFYGGYKPEDKCQNTCVNTKALFDVNACNVRCSTLRTDMILDEAWIASCKASCAQQTDQTRSCSKNFVDCKNHGGYDPNDICKQTCMTTVD